MTDKSEDKKLRILHVVGGMNRAGTETWLIEVLRNIDRRRFMVDFLYHTADECAYDKEIRSLGCRVIRCPYVTQPLTYAITLRRILDEYGPYHVVHSHVHHFSGLVLGIAKAAGVEIRIAHSHSDTLLTDRKAGTIRQCYLYAMKKLINMYATVGIGASQQAARSLFGPNWPNDKRWSVMHCGIDTEPFKERFNYSTVREELGIPPDGLVFGHVGRFDEPKNHSFLVDVACEISRRNSDAYFLLVGEGPLRTEIEQKAREVGVGECTIFTGVRSDVARLMLGAMDVFLFPSLFEGLGLALVEAQAAGLPCLVSDSIPKEADVNKALVWRLSLEESVDTWADEALILASLSSRVDRDLALQKVEESDFNILCSVDELAKIYSCNAYR